MRITRILLLCLPMLAGAVLHAQERKLTTQEVVVRGQRRLADIGAQKTVLDTFALRESVTNSLADVLSQSSSIFIKSYGRGTLATASFRGTAPSHTQVTWNDMKLNSPMLGMVDFSLIPSYFIDEATLYHGASSVGVTGGGLGGAITLSSKPVRDEGFGMKYIQGISSFSTYDQFLHLGYGSPRFKSSTRAYYVDSRNDFKYTNYRKKDFVYDDQGNELSSSYPVERNKNGSFTDLHLLQEFTYDAGNGHTLGLSAWYMDSERGVPMLNVDYKEESQSKNQQDDHTFRGVVSWDWLGEQLKLTGRGGYTYTDLRYRYLGDVGTGELVEMIHSRSFVNTGFGKVGADYYLGEKWIFTANLGLHQHFVKSVDRAMVNNGQQMTIGYDQARTELSGFVSARYKPTERLGLAVNVREEMYGTQWSPVIPAGFAEYLVWEKIDLVAKASVARNYRYPTLNDLYFMPGGNPDLKAEKGFTYDAGIEFQLRHKGIRFTGEATFYDSYIDDWILWLPTFKGFWSPINVKEVHSYGLELKAKLHAGLGAHWWIGIDANYTISKAINKGDPVNWADNAIGKQLVYIPVNSNAVTGRLGWRDWTFTYKYNYYGRRFTTSSNETATKIGLLSPYYMSDISLERSLSLPYVDLSLKLAVNNLFDEEYESVLSRPMAGRNFGFFIEIKPKFRR